MIIHVITDPQVVYVLYCFVTCIGYPLFQALEGQRPSCEAPSAWVPSLASENPTAVATVAIAAGQAVTVTGQRSSKQGLSGKTWKDSPLDK